MTEPSSDVFFEALARHPGWTLALQTKNDLLEAVSFRPLRFAERAGQAQSQSAEETMSGSELVAKLLAVYGDWLRSTTGGADLSRMDLSERSVSRSRPFGLDSGWSSEQALADLFFPGLSSCDLAAVGGLLLLGRFPSAIERRIRRVNEVSAERQRSGGSLRIPQLSGAKKRDLKSGQ